MFIMNKRKQTGMNFSDFTSTGTVYPMKYIGHIVGINYHKSSM